MNVQSPYAWNPRNSQDSQFEPESQKWIRFEITAKYSQKGVHFRCRQHGASQAMWRVTVAGWPGKIRYDLVEQRHAGSLDPSQI